MLSHEDIQAALSARFDGEDPGLPEDAIEAHLAHCEQCQNFERQIARMSQVLVSDLRPSKDLSEVILAGVEPQWRRLSGARQVARVAAVALSLVFVVWAITTIVASGGLMSIAEQGIELNPAANRFEAQLLVEAAAWRLGMAAGLGFVAWRPHHAAGLLPVAATAFFFLTGFAMRDVALGQLLQSQVYTLVGLGAATATLAWVWVADRGYLLTEFWRGITAKPTSS